jgi:hypothetical protein
VASACFGLKAASRTFSACPPRWLAILWEEGWTERTLLGMVSWTEIFIPPCVVHVVRIDPSGDGEPHAVDLCVMLQLDEVLNLHSVSPARCGWEENQPKIERHLGHLPWAIREVLKYCWDYVGEG